MKNLLKIFTKDPIYTISILFLVIFSSFILKAISPSLFPEYYIYIFFSLAAFVIFSRSDFDLFIIFSKHIYILSLALLLLTFFIGSVTRGTIRWIPIGPISLQPAEIVRPFLIIFFADFLTKRNLTVKRFGQALILLLIPVFFILIQPSLGVAILTTLGFVGVIFAISFEKKYILVGLLIALLAVPLFWFVLKPYQKARIINFARPTSDPRGAGYNSIQSKIAVGSGKLFGRNLGKGVQTQLAFLPEKQTDFVFAAVSEELGFVGAFLMLTVMFLIFFRLSVFMENSINPVARAYLSGFLLTLFAEVLVHVGMNLGLLPVAGLPFPLVSAGGSSLLATMIGLGIAISCYQG